MRAEVDGAWTDWSEERTFKVAPLETAGGPPAGPAEVAPPPRAAQSAGVAEARLALQQVRVHASAGRWDLAAAESARAVARGLDPADLAATDWRLLWFRVHLGDAPERRRLVARVLDRYERSDDPEHLFRAVRTSLLVPDTTAEPARFARMAARAATRTPPTVPGETRKLWETLALARYRAGEWEAALDALRTADARGGAHAGTAGGVSFLRAMAHWRAGDREAAREHFTQG